MGKGPTFKGSIEISEKTMKIKGSEDELHKEMIIELFSKCVGDEQGYIS